MKKSYLIKLVSIVLWHVNSYSRNNQDIDTEEKTKRKAEFQKQLQEYADEMRDPENIKKNDLNVTFKDPKNEKIFDELNSIKFGFDLKNREERDEYYKKTFYLSDEDRNAQKILDQLEDSRVQQKEDENNEEQCRTTYIEKKEREEREKDEGYILY